MIILITTDWPLTAITLDVSNSQWESIINRISSFYSSEVNSSLISYENCFDCSLRTWIESLVNVGKPKRKKVKGIRNVPDMYAVICVDYNVNFGRWIGVMWMCFELLSCYSWTQTIDCCAVRRLKDWPSLVWQQTVRRWLLLVLQTRRPQYQYLFSMRISPNVLPPRVSTATTKRSIGWPFRRGPLRRARYWSCKVENIEHQANLWFIFWNKSYWNCVKYVVNLFC